MIEQMANQTKAETSSILEQAAKPEEGRVKLGTFLASVAREAGGGLTDAELALFGSVRIKSPARAALPSDPFAQTLPKAHS